MKRMLLYFGILLPLLLIGQLASAQCTSPPTAGTSIASPASFACAGNSITLDLTGNSAGMGQTYQWEESLTPAGPWVLLGTPASTAASLITPAASRYYRAAVTCNANIQYSSVIQVLVYPTLPAGTFSINKTLPTAGNNFNSFNDAVNALSCGISGPVVFNVAAGTGPYLEQVIIPQIPGTSASNTITINGNSNTLEFTSANSNEPATLKFNGADYLTISNLSIVASGSYGFAVHMTNNSDNNTIQNCYIVTDSMSTSANYVGLAMSGTATSPTSAGSNCDNNLVTNNIINGGYYGVTMSTTSGNTISGNTIKNFYTYGIYSNITTNGIINGNDIFRDTRVNIATYNGIYQSGAASGNQIISNKLHDPFKANPANTSSINGIVLSSSDATAGNGTVIANNKMYNFLGGGTIYGFSNTGSNYALYYHNSVAINDVNYSGTSVARGWHQTTSANGIEIKNNIFSITRSGTGVNTGIYKGTAATTMASDYNDFYINGSGTNHIGYSGTTQTTLAAWQTVSGGDANSNQLDPMFANPYTGDLSPTNIALNDLGTPGAITTDILNQTRSATTPDMGAYEFAMPVCGGTPVSGTITELNGLITACVGRMLTFSASGFSVGSGVILEWQSSPVGLSSWTALAGGNLPTVSTAFFGAQDFRLLVTCVNGGTSTASNVITVSQSAPTLCYCSPLSGTTLHSSPNNYITNVSIPGTTLNNTTAFTGIGGFTQVDHNIPSHTASLVQATPYLLQVSLSSISYNAAAWIDYNQDGLYDPTEYISLTKTGTVATAFISIPATSATGLTGLRVRTYSTSVVGANDACTNTGFETEDYLITIIASVPCAGVPSAAVLSGPASVCAGIPFTLSASSYSTGTGISYEWQRYNNITSVWDVIGTMPVLNIAGQTVAETYRFVTNCINGGGTQASAPLNVVMDNWFGCYCIPVNTNCSTGIYILNVNFGTLSNPSGTCLTANSFSDFKTVAPPVVNQLGTYPITVDATACSVCLGIGFSGDRTAVWIDYDHSGTFDANEFTQLAGVYTNPNNLFTGNITIPATALPGVTAMRVRAYFGQPATGTEACAATGYGETEDYAINIGFPLAIQLAGIEARNAGSRNRIDWSTASEMEANHFVVERSADGMNFSAISTVEAAGIASSYTCWDELPVKGLNYYRLNMKSVDGQDNYSKVVTATVSGKAAFAVEAHPNPIADRVTIGTFGDQGNNPRLIISDVTGKPVYQTTVTGTTTEVSLGGLSKGMYLIKYQDDIQTKTIKVNKL